MNFYVGMELRWSKSGREWKLLEKPRRQGKLTWGAKAVCILGRDEYKIGDTATVWFGHRDEPSLDGWELVRDPFDVWVEEVRANHDV